MSIGLRIITEAEGTPPRALALADAIDLPDQPGVPASLRELLRVGSVPEYRPARWNDDRFIKRFHNCYNYATDVMDYSFAQPGLANDLRPSHRCDEFTAAAVADGLVSVGAEPGLAGIEFGHVVALAMAPADYHWYRLDRNGRWTHKPGECPAIDADNSGQLITDPRMADRGKYTQFCGFFAVPRGGIDITGPHAGVVDRPGADPDPDRLAARTTRAAGTTVVRLHVFSGRPTPEWVLDDDEAASLTATLATTQRGTRLTATGPDGCPLGYRGFEIDRPGATPGTREITTVGRGVVNDVRLTRAERRRDAAGLEGQLLEQARRRGFDSVI